MRAIPGLTIISPAGMNSDGATVRGSQTASGQSFTGPRNGRHALINAAR